VLLVAVFSALGLAPAQAQTLDQQQISTSGGAVIVGGDYPSHQQSLAQTFTAGLSGTLDRVDLHLGRLEAGGDLAPGDITVEIRAAPGGSPSTVPPNPLATTTIPAASIPVFPGAFLTASFAAPAIVGAGTRYAIVAYVTTGDYGWDGASSDVYAGGSLFFSPSARPGAWFPPISTDLAFRTYVTEARQAEPAPGLIPARPRPTPSTPIVPPPRARISVDGLSASGRTLSFRVIASAKVRFTLDRRIAPKRYRRAGSFVSNARRGRNRVRIPRVLDGKPVKRGVYRLSARTYDEVGSGPLKRRIIKLR
jgi:hypothetical protein